jgi:16S rRNA (adenine1518-N6/adenine1519-N6)-dimethyltransferase
MSRARKRFGQHFLEPAWVDKMIRAIDPKGDELFIEIGPGRGALTRPLAARAHSVIAYEIDRDLVAELRAAVIPNVTVVEGDFLELTTRESRANRESRIPNPVAVRVAGNLPYNVASPILFALADRYAGGLPIVDATLMLQREVADRLIASPGSKEYGVLSILLQHRADVEMILKLPPGAFRPAPQVHSALVRLRFHAPRPPVADLALFATLVQAVFTRRRKTLANALLAYSPYGGRDSAKAMPPNRAPTPTPRNAPYGAPTPNFPNSPYGGRESARANRFPTPATALDAAAIDGARRPETLTIAEFARLADAYAAAQKGPSPSSDT